MQPIQPTILRDSQQAFADFRARIRILIAQLDTASNSRSAKDEASCSLPERINLFNELTSDLAIVISLERQVCGIDRRRYSDADIERVIPALASALDRIDRRVAGLGSMCEPVEGDGHG